MSTIKDVARKANVSVTTVSRVLNKNGYVHHDTKKIIEEAMNELQYSPNTFAEGLARGTTNTIGLILNYITNPNSSKLLDILEEECYKKRLKIIIGITRNSKSMEDYYFNLFKKHNIDGIILADKVSNSKSFQSLNKPIVTIDHKLNELVSSINVNYFHGVESVIENFVNEQRKNILILKYKNKSYEDVIQLHNSLIKYDITTTIVELEDDFEKDELNDVISQNSFDGIYTTCDIISISTMSILHKLRIKVPDTCSVVGNYNLSFSSIISPSLTSIEYPAHKIADSAFNIIYNNISENTNKVTHEIIETSLIKRESTK